MNKKVEFLIEEYNEIMKECGEYFFMSISKESQQDAIKKLTILKEKAVVLKKKMIKLKDGDSANASLSLENTIRAHVNELDMWIAFKEDEPHKAWNSLINAQDAARTAMQAYDISPYFEGYSNKLHLLEKLLFPPQLYYSPSFVTKRERCSICGEEYSECDHIVGKAYMGEICCRIIEDCEELKEISIVKEPSNKRSRIFQVMVGDVARDTLTLSTINELEEKITDKNSEKVVKL